MTKTTRPNNFYLDHLLENAARVDAGLPMLRPKKRGVAVTAKQQPAKKETYAKGEINININPFPEAPQKQISKTSTGLNYMMGFDDE